MLPFTMNNVTIYDVNPLPCCLHCKRENILYNKYFPTRFFSHQDKRSNLCRTTTFGTLNLWPLLTGGQSSEVVLCYKKWKWNPKIAVVVGSWSLFGGRRHVRFDSTLNQWFSTFCRPQKQNMNMRTRKGMIVVAGDDMSLQIGLGSENYQHHYNILLAIDSEPRVRIH